MNSLVFFYSIYICFFDDISDIIYKSDIFQFQEKYIYGVIMDIVSLEMEI